MLCQACVDCVTGQEAAQFEQLSLECSETNQDSAVRLEVDSKLLAWECKHLPKQPFSDYFQDFFLWKKTSSDFSFELGQQWLLIMMSFNVFIRNQQRYVLIQHYVNKIESFSTWFIFTIFKLEDSALLPYSPYFVIQTFTCKTNKCYVIPMLIVLRSKRRHNLNSSSWNEAKRTITQRWINGKIARCWRESVSTCQSSLFQIIFKTFSLRRWIHTIFMWFETFTNKC